MHPDSYLFISQACKVHCPSWDPSHQPPGHYRRPFNLRSTAFKLFMNISSSATEREKRKSSKAGDEVVRSRFSAQPRVFLLRHRVSLENVTRVAYEKRCGLSIFTQRSVSLPLTRGSLPISLAVTLLEYPSPKKGTRAKSTSAQCS